MAHLNITYNGISFDLPGEIEDQLSDAQIRELAQRSLSRGEGLDNVCAAPPEQAFAGHIVDRIDGHAGRQRIYLRPKVPFG